MAAAAVWRCTKCCCGSAVRCAPANGLALPCTAHLLADSSTRAGCVAADSAESQTTDCCLCPCCSCVLDALSRCVICLLLCCFALQRRTAWQLLHGSTGLKRPVHRNCLARCCCYKPVCLQHLRRSRICSKTTSKQTGSMNTHAGGPAAWVWYGQDAACIATTEARAGCLQDSSAPGYLCSNHHRIQE